MTVSPSFSELSGYSQIVLDIGRWRLAGPVLCTSVKAHGTLGTRVLCRIVPSGPPLPCGCYLVVEGRGNLGTNQVSVLNRFPYYEDEYQGVTFATNLCEMLVGEKTR